METDTDELEDEEADDWLDTRWSGAVDPFSVPLGVAACRETLCHPSSSGSAQQQDTSGAPPVVVSAVQGPDQMLTRMQLNDNKAGMDGLDKEKINQIVYEASKGSKYFENEKKKEEQVQQRIEELRLKQSKITETQLKQGLEEANRLLEELEMSRDLSHTIVHVDMDAYYAAVEMRDNPSLRDKPMAVGGNSMLSTSNYHARKYGVRAAMPGFIAKKLCPHLVLVNPNYEEYTAVSKQVREILADYDPNFSPMSLDEAYLDITKHLKQRANLTDLQRSYLVRSCDEMGPAWCGCDLNEILRDSVVGVSLPKQVDHDHDKQDDQSNKHLQDNESEKHLQGNQSDKHQREDQSNKHLQEDQSNKHLHDDQSNKHLHDDQSNKHLHDDQSNKHLQDDQSNKHLQGGETGCTNRCPRCGKMFPRYSVEVFGQSVEEAVKEMRCRIQQKTQLTASAGIAPNTMLAKVCSDRNKPNGQFRILPDRQQVMDFIRALPIRKIPGIGKVSETMLRSLGVVNCQDLFEKRGLLYHLYSTVAFNHFMHICLAIGSTTVERDSERKSISTERTFSELSRPSDLYKKCSELCAALVEDLGQQEVRGKTVSIKIKTVKFEVKTRAHSLAHHTAEYQDIFTAARELLRVEIQAVQPQALRLRLMGVRLSNLLHQSSCGMKRQDTITGLFKKMAARSPQKTQTLDSVRHIDSRQMDLPQLPVYFSDVCDGTGNETPDTQCQDGIRIAGTDDKDIEKECSAKRSISELAAVIRKPKPVKGRSRNTRKKTNPKTHPQSVALADLVGTDIDKKTAVGEVNHDTFDDVQSCYSDSKGSGRGKASGQKGKRKRQTDLDVNSHPAEQSGESSGYESAKQAEHWSSTGQCADLPEHNKSHHGGSDNVPSPDGSVKSDPSAGSSSEDVQNLKVFQCPVCQQVVECKNLNYFNDHVDVCLFRQISSQKDHQKNVVTDEEDHKAGGEGLTYVARSSERDHTSIKHAIPKFPQLETNNNETSKMVDSFEPSQQNQSKSNRVPSGKIPSHLGDREADWQHSTLNGTDTGGSCEPTEGTNPEADQGEVNAVEYSGTDTAPDQAVPHQEAEFYACPICNVEKIGCSLEDFNEHVDSCLSRRAIKQILEEQKISDSPPAKRPTSSTSPSQPPPTKKKRSSCGQMKTIYSFFKP
ncbi:DNA polymerase kappa-like [Haliotis rubra]|uniref:DNA polymerase kappa-like n=1 Tax=Haliotis rubra TaxID=36100 RepID=UPI001EE54079|nr:DNA polymerase kappa-like [Haliotis rubra]